MCASRATEKLNAVPRSASSAGVNAVGMNTSTALPGKRKSGGTTPITVYFAPSSTISRPTRFGSAPKRRVHKLRLTTTTGVLSATSSGANVRPTSGCRPSTDSKFGVVRSASSRSGSPSPVRLYERALKRGDVLERAAALAPVDVARERDRRSRRAADRGAVVPEEHEPVRIGERQRLQQHRAHEAEDRGVRADAERDDQHGERRESRCARQRASRRSGHRARRYPVSSCPCNAIGVPERRGPQPIDCPTNTLRAVRRSPQRVPHARSVCPASGTATRAAR